MQHLPAPLHDIGPPDALVQAVLRAAPQVGTAPWQALAGGRSNRLWRAGALVVKLYDPAASSPLFPNDPGAEAQALRLIGPAGLAPNLRAEGPGWIAYDHLPGAVWSGDPAPVAIALGKLHSHGKNQAGFRHVGSGSRALQDQARAIAAACTAKLPPPPNSDIPPASADVLIHGDAVAGNVIENGPTITLIDWQCPAIGDAAEDIAAFLSPAMQWLYRGAVLTPDQHTRFLAAYPDQTTVARYRALAPAFHWRMAAHCQWKAERGAADYAAALALELAAIA